ncbi:MAG: 16S rRNA (guanine(527)-N(7))-methyltransferase RsmG [Clostridia bacterium]|nr:16S rRNA (guanine(527)-N(7))-methyltransferase RsmG [Clostridia bacterium]
MFAMEIRNINEIYQQEIVKNKEKLDEFRALLLEYNQKYNLTTILEEKDVYYKHFLDSAAGMDLFTKGARVAEIGSGAGFPSMVLKLLRDDLSFDLFESVGKKCEFLRAVVDKFQLKNVHIYNLRAEDGAKDFKFREKYDFVTARAVARMNTLSEYCLPFVKKGGKFIAYKSGDTTEIEEAQNAYKTLGGKLVNVIEYSLPEEYGDRVLAIVEKVKPTPPRYPRGQGKERKNPL